jgi:hypothetical protein
MGLVDRIHLVLVQVLFNLWVLYRNYLKICEHVIMIVYLDWNVNGGERVAHKGGSLEFTFDVVLALEVIGLEGLLDHEQPVFQLLHDVRLFRLEHFYIDVV